MGDPGAYWHYAIEKEKSRVKAGHPDFKCCSKLEPTKKLWLNHSRLTTKQKEELQDLVNKKQISAAVLHKLR